MRAFPNQRLRVDICGRVATSDKCQNPGVPIWSLWEFVSARGWEMHREYVDAAPATDLSHPYQWRQLLEDASKRKLDLLLVWRIDRAFRSVLDAATPLERPRTWGVGLRSYSEPWLDTISPFGEALYYITVAYLQLERGILRERVKAGMDRARKPGKMIGRPWVTDRRGLKKRFGASLEDDIFRSQAAKELNIGYATLKWLLDALIASPTEESL